MAHDPVAALPLYTAGTYNYTVFVAGEAVGTAALAVHAGLASAASVVEGVAATYVAGDAGWVTIHAVDDWGNRLTQVRLGELDLQTWSRTRLCRQIGGMWCRCKQRYGRRGSLTAFAPCESPTRAGTVTYIVRVLTLATR